MSTFIEWLQHVSERDTRVRAALRRSLAFDPSSFPGAFPYVERFLGDDASLWRRQAHYLVAALWAMHWKEGRSGPVVSLSEAMAGYARRHHQPESLDKGDSSTERRFVALLDADADQLPHRLRQVVALLKDEAIDFDALLRDLLRWHTAQKPVQQKWARDFYRALGPPVAPDTGTTTQEETA